MKYNEIEERVKLLLEKRRAYPIGDVKSINGIKTREYIYPDLSVREIELGSKNEKSSIVVPVTTEDKLLFIIKSEPLARQGSVIKLPETGINLKDSISCADYEGFVNYMGYSPRRIDYISEFIYMYSEINSSLNKKVDLYSADSCFANEWDKKKRDYDVVAISQENVEKLIEKEVITDEITKNSLMTYFARSR